jgi:hypothetical protein
MLVNLLVYMALLTAASYALVENLLRRVHWSSFKTVILLYVLPTLAVLAGAAALQLPSSQVAIERPLNSNGVFRSALFGATSRPDWLFG